MPLPLSLKVMAVNKVAVTPTTSEPLLEEALVDLRWCSALPSRLFISCGEASPARPTLRRRNLHRKNLIDAILIGKIDLSDPCRVNWKLEAHKRYGNCQHTWRRPHLLWNCQPTTLGLVAISFNTYF